jgi:hypothetical protein
MSRAGKDQIGRPELFDATQALKLRSVEKRPSKLVERIIPEGNQAVYGVANALIARFPLRFNSVR